MRDYTSWIIVTIQYLHSYDYSIKNTQGDSSMSKIGFDNQKYLTMQSEHIKERISQFGDKLYLEFGGKLFDDYHASRVLPGFAPDSSFPTRLRSSLSSTPLISRKIKSAMTSVSLTMSMYSVWSSLSAIKDCSSEALSSPSTLDSTLLTPSRLN